MSKIKVGIIGCGGIANQKHLPALSRRNDVEIVAFCDIIEERAAKAAKEYGVEGALVCTDYKELVAIPEIETVHVLTPNVSHCELTCAALDAGKHVICEKPMAATPEDAKKMLEDTDYLIQDIAEQCGYDDALTFSKAFRQLFGVSPRGYRKREPSE